MPRVWCCVGMVASATAVSLVGGNRWSAFAALFGFPLLGFLLAASEAAGGGWRVRIEAEAAFGRSRRRAALAAVLGHCTRSSVGGLALAAAGVLVWDQRLAVAPAPLPTLYAGALAGAAYGAWGAAAHALLPGRWVPLLLMIVDAAVRRAGGGLALLVPGTHVGVLVAGTSARLGSGRTPLSPWWSAVGLPLLIVLWCLFAIRRVSAAERRSRATANPVDPLSASPRANRRS
jgi:hypothetical protein